MRNLAEETMEILQHYSYTTDDIYWIGTLEFIISSKDFWMTAKNTIYDNGYGIKEIPSDLIIMMRDDTWFERASYDGSEWWRHVTPPEIPSHRRRVVLPSFAESDFLSTIKWNRLSEYCAKQDLSTDMYITEL